MTASVTFQDGSAVDFEAIARMTRDQAASGKLMSEEEARYLVDSYYMMQNQRIRAGHQMRTLAENEEPATVLEYLAKMSEMLERQVARGLEKYAEASPVGSWAMSVCGIGPVLAAGLLAHIQIGDSRHVSRKFQFAGVTPSVAWEKGQRRPHNARLKTLLYKIGESFVKVQGNDKDFYGWRFAARKSYEWKNNLSGKLSDQALEWSGRMRPGSVAKLWYDGHVNPEWAALQIAKEKTFPATPAQYPKAALLETPGPGMLPPGHIHARARRWTFKLFVSHYFEVAFFVQNGVRPKPVYVLAHLGHTDYIVPPNTHLVEGFDTAKITEF